MGSTAPAAQLSSHGAQSWSSPMRINAATIARAICATQQFPWGAGSMMSRRGDQGCFIDPSGKQAQRREHLDGC